ncbi:transcriptional initiation protein Tat [Haloferax sp. MBLA0076]|uniref:Transcriptional initiation protein Tat n=1 Tax=Haloferax litoreum TaxID=2666140 RepID=A0A6A8GJ99_9EURY|nr:MULTISPECIES: transcriptional initiation protein Tat [Haloferax]KAB1193994.1 transcriptional initiation protein Tat [Haloferax sp. CBA1148]MRX22542.1 transcriptional initiation protein Tat [Haloferax litoreum]
MSPDEQRPSTHSDDQRSTLSRRQLLGLLGGGGALAGIGWFAPEWLPDPVTDTLTTMYPDPSSNYVWRPPVSDEHADEAVQRLEETVERATVLASQVDFDTIDEDMRFHLRGSPAGGHLESARDKLNARDRLQHATTGLQYAGETIGYAKVALGEDDPEFLVERSRELERTTDETVDSISEYRVSDPGRDLAYLYSVERLLSFARINIGWDRSADDESNVVDDYSPRDFAAEWGSHLQAKQRIRTARYYREQYRSGLGDDPRSHRERLDDALLGILAEIDRYPTRDEMRTKLEDELDLDQSTPYGAARWELFTLCFDNDFRYIGDFERDLTMKHLVDSAQSLLARQAHEFALSELDVEPEDSDYDSGRSFRAKRRAMHEFRETHRELDSHFAGVVASEAASRIRGGDVGLEIGDGVPRWQLRVESAVYYFVGEGMMRNLGDVVDPLLSAENSR